MYENTHRNPQPPPSSLMTGGYSTGGGHVSIEEAARKAARALILAGEGDR